MGPPADDRPATRRRSLLVLAAMTAALAAMAALALLFVPRDADEIGQAVRSAGAAAIPAYVLAGALLTAAFFPFPIVAATGGLLFGVAAGTGLAVLAETLGATAALLVARHGARERALALAGPRLVAILEGVARRGFTAVLLARVLPGVPRHPANYAFGLTAIGLAAFVAATVLGTAPRALGYAALGGTLGDLRSPASIAAVAGLMAFGALGLWLAARDPDLRALVRARRRSR